MKLNKILDFLKSSTDSSTMRVNVTFMGLSCTILIGSMAFNIIYDTFHKLPIAWEGQAIFLGGITTLMTGVLWQKASQKKIELSNSQVPLENITNPSNIQQPIINR